MKKLAGLLILCLSSVSVMADDWSGHASLYAGRKSIDKKDWNGYDDISSGGILLDFKKQSWPVSIAIDLIGSSKDKSSPNKKTEIDFSEIDLGIRKIWDNDSTLSPYIGVGLALVNAERELFDTNGSTTIHTKYDDSTVGGWIGAGTYWNVTDSFTLGLDLRYTYADVDLGPNKNLDAGGYNMGVTAGLSW